MKRIFTLWLLTISTYLGLQGQGQVKVLSLNNNQPTFTPNDTILKLNLLSPIPGGSFWFESDIAKGYSEVKKFDSTGMMTTHSGSGTNSYRVGLNTTNDNGYVVGLNWRSSNGFFPSVDRADSAGNILWQRSLPNPNGWFSHFIYDVTVFPNGNIAALGDDSLYIFNDSGQIVNSFHFRGPGDLHAVTDSTLLISADGVTGSFDLYNGFIWQRAGDGKFQKRNSSYFLVILDQLSVIDVNTGIDSSVHYISGSSTYDLGYHGDIFYSTGNVIMRMDTSQTLIWMDTVPGADFGLNVFALPDGRCVAGGGYRSYICTGSPEYIDYSAFIGIIDSSANSPLWSLDNVIRGDANADKKVMPDDLVYIGVAQGANSTYDLGYQIGFHTPTEMKNVNADWQQHFPSGLNYKHCDSNSDNAVDTLDFFYYPYCNAVYFSYPTLQNLCDSTIPSFDLIPERDTAQTGDTLRFYLTAGSMNAPIDSLFGLSFGAKLPGLSWPPGQLVFAGSSALSGPLGNPSDIRVIPINSYHQYFYFTMMRRDHQNGYNFTGDTIAWMDIRLNQNLQNDSLLRIETAYILAMTADGTEIPVSMCTAPYYQLANPQVSVGSISEHGFSIYPIPAGNHLTVDFGNELSEKKIFINDLAGRSVKYLRTDLNKIDVDVHDLSDGIYFLRIVTASYEINRKLVFKK